MRIDTAQNSFNMQEIQNRRFTFNPQTGTLILGRQYSGNQIISSHAEEHGQVGAGEPFDDFVRGWIGTGRSYTDGVIHFAPPIPKDNAEMFDKGYSTLEMFAQNGADSNTVIRGFPGAWEQPLSNVMDNEKTTDLRKELNTMHEPLNIQLSNREQQDAGAWLKLPATAEQLNAALARIGAQGGNFVITGIETPIRAVERVPLENLQKAGIDELNYLAAALQSRDYRKIDKLTAAIELMTDKTDIHNLTELTQNTGVYDFHPDIANNIQLGEHTLEHSGLIQIPDEWAAAIDIEKLGELAAAHEKGVFTEYGYIVPNGEEWKPVTEIPKEYQIAPKIEKPGVEYDTIATRTVATVTAKPPAQVTPAVAAAPFVLVADNPRDKLKEITGKLENGIKGIFDSEQYKSYLKTLSKFHNYSFNNCLLIAMQKPDATHVAGFNAWRDDFKRQVMKGEKGIKILAPAPFKAKKEVDKLGADGKPIIGKDGRRVKEQQEITVPAFKVTTVFDVSQTDGEPLPEIGVDELTGSVDRYKDFFAALEKTSHVPIAFEAISTGAKGYYQQEEKRIAINEGMSELQTLKTAIHEIAHSRLHDIDKNAPKDTPRPDRDTREVEAESIAYTVCAHYGLDTSDYSFGYVATWSGDKQLDTLKTSLDTIRKEADAIITEVDKHFAELSQDKEQTAEKSAPGQEQGDTFTIYQLKDGDETRDLRFESLATVSAAGLAVALDNYDKVYGAPLDGNTTLENLYYTFNMDRPDDFTGHSLSVSDIVTLNRDGKETAFYVDSAGFKELPDFLTPEQENRMQIHSAVHSNYNGMVALVGADDKVYLGKEENYHFISSVALPWHKEGQEYGDAPSYYDNSDNSLVFVSDNLQMYGFMYGDGWTKSQADMLKDGAFTQADYKEFARIQSEVVNGLPYKDNFTGVKFDGKPFDPTPAPPIDLTAVADYMQKQNNAVRAADPNKTQGQAAFNMAVKRLNAANEKIPGEHPELKALITHAAQSPDLATLKERMNTLNTDFIQHYSTAAQMTIDTSGKAEPTAPAATVRRTEPAPAQKAPPRGENVAAIEAKVNAGETINLSDLASAIKADKQAAQATPPEKAATGKTATQTRQTNSRGKGAAKQPEKPSIREELAAGKKQLAAQKSAPARAQNKNAEIGG